MVNKVEIKEFEKRLREALNYRVNRNKIDKFIAEDIFLEVNTGKKYGRGV